MTEEEHIEHIKKQALSAIGIDIFEGKTPTPAERHMHRMKQQADIDRLEAEMEAHKRKLEKELADAEVREKLYEGNAAFGAF